MAFMAYLIVVTARTIPKIWNPYDILGISDVSSSVLYACVSEKSMLIWT